jgi:hypothetical protein
MTSKKARAKWGRRWKRLRPYLLRHPDYDGRWKRRQKFNKLLTLDIVECIRHLKETPNGTTGDTEVDGGGATA